MESFCNLSVTDLIDLIKQEHQDHQDRKDQIAKIENQIFHLNADIYAIRRRGLKFEQEGSKYLAALNEAVAPTL